MREPLKTSELGREVLSLLAGSAWGQGKAGRDRGH